MNRSDSQDELLNDLAYEFVEGVRRGEAVDVEGFAEAHPGMAAEIRRLFPAMLLLERLDSVRPARDTMPQAKEPDVPQRLGDYRIVKPIGEGGIARVYLAVQESLGRPWRSKCSGTNELTRDAWPVLPERRQVLAQLHHTNIVPVFDFGEESGVHYYAMQFIAGESLDRFIQRMRRLRATAAPSSPARTL